MKVGTRHLFSYLWLKRLCSTLEDVKKVEKHFSFSFVNLFILFLKERIHSIKQPFLVKRYKKENIQFLIFTHGLRTPGEEIAFTARPKIQSQSQIFRYDQSIFCLPHRPTFSDIFDLCLHWVSVVRGLAKENIIYFGAK